MIQQLPISITKSSQHRRNIISYSRAISERLSYSNGEGFRAAWFLTT